jgi:hypothetical protein
MTDRPFNINEIYSERDVDECSSYQKQRSLHLEIPTGDDDTRRTRIIGTGTFEDDQKYEDVDQTVPSSKLCTWKYVQDEIW